MEVPLTRGTYRANVVVSSTLLDLEEHRVAVINAIWRCGMFPLAMERDPALPIDTITYSQQLVDQADIYIGVFAFRYGAVTEVELRHVEAAAPSRARPDLYDEPRSCYSGKRRRERSRQAG